MIVNYYYRAFFLNRAFFFLKRACAHFKICWLMATTCVRATVDIETKKKTQTQEKRK